MIRSWQLNEFCLKWLLKMYNLLPLNAGTNTFGSANLLLNWWELLWEHHHIEIIWAAVFAVIFGFLWEWFLHPYIKKVEIFIKLKKIIEKFWKRGNTTFHEVEIANSIKSNYPKEVTSISSLMQYKNIMH